MAAVAAVVVVLGAAGCSGGGSSASASSPASAPSQSFDRSTVRACEYAGKAVEGDGEKSFQATQDALSAAELSDVPALRQIAEKYTSDGTTAGNISASTGGIRIQTWCLDHGLSRP